MLGSHPRLTIVFFRLRIYLVVRNVPGLLSIHMTLPSPDETAYNACCFAPASLYRCRREVPVLYFAGEDRV